MKTYVLLLLFFGTFGTAHSQNRDDTAQVIQAFFRNHSNSWTKNQSRIITIVKHQTVPFSPESIRCLINQAQVQGITIAARDSMQLKQVPLLDLSGYYQSIPGIMLDNVWPPGYQKQLKNFSDHFEEIRISAPYFLSPRVCIMEIRGWGFNVLHVFIKPQTAWVSASPAELCGYQYDATLL